MSKFSILLFLGGVLSVCACAAHAFEPPAPEELREAENSFLLRPGAVVGARRAMIYLMEPEGVVARDVSSGAVVWRTPAAAQPLGFHGEKLMALAEADQPNVFEVLFLNAGDGTVEARVPASLPGEVRGTIDDGPAHRFNTAAAVIDGVALLFWNYTSRPLRGAPAVSGINRASKMPRVSAPAAEATAGPPTEELLSETEQGQRLAGVLRLDPVRGMAIPLEGDLPAAPAFVPDLQPDERLSGLSGRQFRSADNRHVLASERIADNTVWNRYQWSISERPEGRMLGVIARSNSFAPFFVVDDLLVYVSQPFERRNPDGTVEARQPSLNAVDLETLRPAWSAILRDTAFRGAMPP